MDVRTMMLASAEVNTRISELPLPAGNPEGWFVLETPG